MLPKSFSKKNKRKKSKKEKNRSNSSVIPTIQSNENTSQNVNPLVNSQTASTTEPPLILNQNGSDVTEALNYLDEVKSRYSKNPKVYDTFILLMSDFKCNLINTGEVLIKIRDLFRGEADLIEKFKNFLPQKPKSIENVAVNYVYKIKERFTTNSKIYRTFVSKLHSYQHGQLSLDQICENVSKLFDGHDDLIQGFIVFLPNPNSYEFSNGILHKKTNDDNKSYKKIKKKSKIKKKKRSLKKRSKKESLKKYYESENTDSKSNSSFNSDYESDSISNTELMINSKSKNSFHFESKYNNTQSRKRKKITSDKKNLYEDDESFDYEDDDDDEDSGGSDDDSYEYIQEEGEEEEDREIITPINNNNYQNNEELIGMDFKKTINSAFGIKTRSTRSTNNANTLFRKIKTKIPRINYQCLVKILDIYCLHLIPKNNVMNFAEELINDEKNHALVQCFKQLLYYGDLVYQDWKGDVLIPIRELDFSKQQSNGSSYNYLPNCYHSIPCQGKKELEKKIINVKWVCVSSFRDYANIPATELNQFKEYILGLEEERFELDIKIENLKTSLRKLKKIKKEIKTLYNEESEKIDINYLFKDQFFLQSLNQIYEEETHTILEVLQETPLLTVPVIYKRCKKRNIKLQQSKLKLNDLWKQATKIYYDGLVEYNNQKYIQLQSDRFSIEKIMNEINEKPKYLYQYDFIGFEKTINTNQIMKIMLDLLLISVNYLGRLQTLQNEPCFPKEIKIENVNNIHKKNRKSLLFKIKQKLRILINDWLSEFFLQWYNTNIDDDANNINNINTGMNMDMDIGMGEDASQNKVNTKPKIKQKIMYTNEKFFVFFKYFGLLMKSIKKLKKKLLDKHLELISQLTMKMHYPNSHNNNRITNNSKILNQLQNDLTQDSFQLFLPLIKELISKKIKEEEYINECKNLFGYSSYKFIQIDKLLGSMVSSLIYLIHDTKCKSIISLFTEQKFTNFNLYDERRYLLNYKILFPNQLKIFRIQYQKCDNNESTQKENLEKIRINELINNCKLIINMFNKRKDKSFKNSTSLFKFQKKRKKTQNYSHNNKCLKEINNKTFINEIYMNNKKNIQNESLNCKKKNTEIFGNGKKNVNIRGKKHIKNIIQHHYEEEDEEEEIFRRKEIKKYNNAQITKEEKNIKFENNDSSSNIIIKTIHNNKINGIDNESENNNNNNTNNVLENNSNNKQLVESHSTIKTKSHTDKIHNNKWNKKQKNQRDNYLLKIQQVLSYISKIPKIKKINFSVHLLDKDESESLNQMYNNYQKEQEKINFLVRESFQNKEFERKQFILKNRIMLLRNKKNSIVGNKYSKISIIERKKKENEKIFSKDQKSIENNWVYQNIIITNNLQSKLDCSISKLIFVSGTEDLFYRQKYLQKATQTYENKKNQLLARDWLDHI
ncbi:sin3b-related [Anaeramoeba flamelloides]|uniref:Sin3b-related n=1 Tax=Anaeramoeba flamelloides TaxID=1746091 RepID=A0ABQ8XA77_9EUKA|nr:sin3b-related [Anaeramoeba flamelloides]